jgi:hypothetical protein
MAQHFLLSATARSLSAGKIMRMSESGVENVSCVCVGPRLTANPCALTVAAWFAIRASDRRDSRDSAARRAIKISRLPRAPFSLGTSCRCELILSRSLPSATR